MKILHIATSLDSWGGIEKYIAGLSEELMRRGHELYCTTMPGSPLDERFPGIRIPTPKKGKFDLETFRAHRRVIRENGIEVVNMHFTPDFYVGGWAARLTGCPRLVMTRHVAEPWPRVKAFQYGKVFDQVVAVSDAVQKVLISSGVPAAKVTVAKAGICPVASEISREEARRRLGFEGFVFGVVGRLTREKGVDVAIEAAIQARSRLEIFGEGPEEASLRALAAPSAKIGFHGFVQDVAPVWEAIDCLIVPSRWTEAFPLAVLEAMSVAQPIIAARVGGLPEMVADGQTGILFEKEDARELASAMGKLETDPLLARKLGNAGLVRFTEEFTLKKMGDRFEAIYKSC